MTTHAPDLDAYSFLPFSATDVPERRSQFFDFPRFSGAVIARLLSTNAEEYL
jgi:hypothetical protein